MAVSLKFVFFVLLPTLLVISLLGNWFVVQQKIFRGNNVDSNVSGSRHCESLPTWMQAYADWHRQNIIIDKQTGQTRLKGRRTQYLIWACHSHKLCGGLGDRIRAIVSALYLAMSSQRVLLILWEKPSRLDRILQPHCIHWIPPPKYAKDSELRMNHDDTPDSLFRKLEQRQNDRIVELSMSPEWHEEAWRDNLQMQAYWEKYGSLCESEHGLYYTAFWTLFQWSNQVQSRSNHFLREIDMLEEPYVGVHWRTGIVQGMENYTRQKNKVTYNKVLECSHKLQHLMLECTNDHTVETNSSFASSGPKIYFASDNMQAKKQIQALDPTNIRIVSDMEILHVDYTHNEEKMSTMTDIEQANVDAWAELKILIDSKCLVTSRSGFSDMARLLSSQEPRCFASLAGKCNGKEIERVSKSLGC